MGCNIFSRDYTLPSGATYLSKHDLIVGGGCRLRRDGEMLLAPSASGRLTSFSVEGRGSRAD